MSEAVKEVEGILDEMYEAKQRYLSVQDKQWIHRVILTEKDVPERVYQKFIWYNVMPVNFNDGVCTQIWGY